MVRVTGLLLAASVVLGPAAAASSATQRVAIGSLDHGARAALIHTANGAWGVTVSGAGSASAFQPQPAAVELDTGASPLPAERPAPLPRRASGYRQVRRTPTGVVGTATVPAAGAKLVFTIAGRSWRGPCRCSARSRSAAAAPVDSCPR